AGLNRLDVEPQPFEAAHHEGPARKLVFDAGMAAGNAAAAVDDRPVTLDRLGQRLGPVNGSTRLRQDLDPTAMADAVLVLHRIPNGRPVRPQRPRGCNPDRLR